MQRDCKEKCPDKTLSNKEPPKISLSSFCVGHVLLGMGPALKNCLEPSDSPLEKTNF